MTTTAMTTAFWFVLLLGVLAAVLGTVRVIRADRRPTSDVAWSDWREERLWHNVRVS